MNHIIEKINAVNWQKHSDEMDTKGYTIIPGFLNATFCEQMVDYYDNWTGYRKTVVMERHRFGLGEYKYFDYPLPDIVQTMRENLYPKLVPIANRWMDMLRIDTHFPNELEALHKQCHKHGQLKPTPLILKYGIGGFNTLHQDLYGEIYFPLQAVIMLSEPDTDFTGGELVFTEQVPRAQSKAIVLKPGKGDMIIFTTNFRPVRGSKGYYRANMRHGVSEVQIGERYTTGLIFHDAAS